MRPIRRRDLPAQPWRNGGGVTREIAVHPQGAGLDGPAFEEFARTGEQNCPVSNALRRNVEITVDAQLIA